MDCRDNVGIALGKVRKRRICSESVKPFIGVQLVKVQPGQSRSGQAGSKCCHAAGRLAGAEAYTARKQAVRIELRNLMLLRMPTTFPKRKAASGCPLERGYPESPESEEPGACFQKGSPVNPGNSLCSSLYMGMVRPNPNRTRSPGREGPHGKQNNPRPGVIDHQGQPEGIAKDNRGLLRTNSTREGGESQGSRKGRPRYPLEGRGEQLDVPSW